MNRARMLEHRIQHLTEMLETCWNIVPNITIMDICFSNNAPNTNTQQFKIQFFFKAQPNDTINVMNKQPFFSYKKTNN